MIVLALTLAMAGADLDAVQTGKDIEQMCMARGANAQTQCLAYVGGAVAMAQSLISAPEEKLLCMKKSVTTAEARDAILGYLRDNPDLRSETAGGAITLALMNAYPCPKS